MSNINRNIILENIFDIESREEHYLALEIKRDELIKELQSLSSNVPVIIEENKKMLVFRHNNNDYIDKYNAELAKVTSEQEVLINNIRSSMKEVAEKLAFTEKYKIMKKNLNLSREELMNIIFDEIIEEKLKEVELVI